MNADSRGRLRGTRFRCVKCGNGAGVAPKRGNDEHHRNTRVSRQRKETVLLRTNAPSPHQSDESARSTTLRSNTTRTRVLLHQ